MWRNCPPSSRGRSAWAKSTRTSGRNGRFRSPRFAAGNVSDSGAGGECGKTDVACRYEHRPACQTFPAGTPSVRHQRPFRAADFQFEIELHGRDWKTLCNCSRTIRARVACRVSSEQANMWVYGEKGGSPAFVISGTPPPPEPYAVYVVTDRPIYRPGHKVQFKGTVRQRFEADAPGGFTYGVFANKALNVEIRDATDALLSRQTITTNANGSFDGSFQLAGEPTLGNWQICVAVSAHFGRMARSAWKRTASRNSARK